MKYAYPERKWSPRKWALLILLLLILFAVWNWSNTPEECKSGIYIKNTEECIHYNILSD